MTHNPIALISPMPGTWPITATKSSFWSVSGADPRCGWGCRYRCGWGCNPRCGCKGVFCVGVGVCVWCVWVHEQSRTSHKPHTHMEIQKDSQALGMYANKHAHALLHTGDPAHLVGGGHAELEHLHGKHPVVVAQNKRAHAHIKCTIRSLSWGSVT